MYALSALWWYSMLFFIYFFNENKKKYKKIFKLIYIAFILIACLIIFTPLFIKNVQYIEEKSYYFETYWSLYLLLALFYLLTYPLFIFTSIKKLKSLQTINKARLKYIIIGISCFMLSALILLVIFPLFWELYFENLLVLTLLPVLIGTFYAIHNYNFVDLKIKIWQIIVNLFALGNTILIYYIVNKYFSHLWEWFSNIWHLTQNDRIWDFIFWLIIFLSTRHILSKIFLWKWENKFITELNNFKKHIPYITNIDDLNFYIKNEFQKIFKLKYIWILIDNKKDKNQEIYKYFQSHDNRKLFINDFVFIEENKHKFNSKLITKGLHNDAYLVLPLKDNKENIIGLLQIGKKPFHEQYTISEINTFHDFKTFLEGHLKYIEIYKKIHDLSVNLDKKIDKQTIEYNQLINKQKEFISYVSHEVKWPIASSIFQIDSIIEEVIDDELNKKNLLKELHILNDLLLKTWELVNKLFSIQQFELNSNSLFKERVHLINLLKHEVWLFQKIHTSVTFITDFDSSITYIELDKVQFRQVIDNLLNNAIKVIDPEEWEISISCKKEKKEIIIEIEDNWKWFSNLDVKKIFDKYSTWKWSSVWLWMGLYLCKTIVELHWWNIQAAFWKKLWWAKIIIKIPII